MLNSAFDDENLSRSSLASNNIISAQNPFLAEMSALFNHAIFPKLRATSIWHLIIVSADIMLLPGGEGFDLH